MSIRLIMDSVDGHVANISIYSGRISRMAIAVQNDLPFSLSDPGALLRILLASGLPAQGDPYPFSGYDQYFLKDYNLRAIDSSHYTVEMVYQYRGLLVIKDSSTLTSVSSQLHPAAFAPLYVKWTNPGDPNAKQIKKVLTLQTTLPLRHLTASQTIDFIASADVLTAFGGVNDDTWKGLPKGYWLFSEVSGETVDNGITYTYSVTLSTKQVEDWSQLGYMQSDTGKPILIPASDVSTLRATPYAYSLDDSVNGLLKVGMHPLVDFSSLFGF